MYGYEDGDCRRKRWSEWSLKARVGMIVGAIILIPAFFILFPFVTMQLWNWLMPGIFKLPAIGFWQAVGILILSHILFKSGPIGRTRGSRWKKAGFRKQRSVDQAAAKPA